MFYIVYQITNLINNKIYIGRHVAVEINDGYMGSGKALQSAYNKYGVDNFKKEILFIFDNFEDMNNKEAELVTWNFCLREDTYNIAIGGFGGFEHINNAGLNGSGFKNFANLAKAHQILKEKYGENWHKIILCTNGSKKGIPIFKEKYANDPKFAARILAGNLKGRTTALTDKAKAKRKATLANIKHQQGERNSQYGTCWVTNGAETKKIKREELDSFITLGYYKGRI
jgi:hypothetical protein